MWTVNLLPNSGKVGNTRSLYLFAHTRPTAALNCTLNKQHWLETCQTHPLMLANIIKLLFTLQMSLVSKLKGEVTLMNTVYILAPHKRMIVTHRESID